MERRETSTLIAKQRRRAAEAEKATDAELFRGSESGVDRSSRTRP